jgi:hypothetical protein
MLTQGECIEHQIDDVWAATAGQQELYDAIANPANLLPSNEFSWTATEVTLTPNGGLSLDDFILIQ